MDPIIELTVDPQDNGMRIDAYLRAHTEFSRSRVSALMLEGAICVDGEVQVKPSFKVSEGQRIALSVPQTRPVDILPQNTHAEAMVCRDKAIVAALPDQCADAPFHLSGSFRSEGDAQDVSGMDARRFHKICIPVGQRLGFSGTGAGDNAYVSFRSRHCLDLLRIQFVENILHIYSKERAIRKTIFFQNRLNKSYIVYHGTHANTRAIR